MSAHRTAVALICSALLMAACGATATPSSTPTTPAAGTVAGWTVGDARGVATDQTCTTTTTAGDAVGRVGLGLDDLMRMVLDRQALGAEGTDWQQGPNRGFVENQELAMFGFGGAGGCGKLTSTGRISGYDSGWMSSTSNAQVQSAVHLFLTEQGAAAFATWYPTLMKVGDPAGEGITVSSVTTTPQPALGVGAAMVDIIANGWTAREVVFRVKNVVGVVTVGATAREGWPVDPQKLGPLALDKVRSAQVSDEPLDAVVALSMPLQREAFPKDLASLPWDAWFGGTLDTFDAADLAGDPGAAARLAANGFLYSARGFYMGDAQTPKVSSAIEVYATSDGAATERTATIERATEGSSQIGAATLFDVGIPGAVGWTRVVSGGEGGSSLVDTRVLLPVRGQLLPYVYIHDTKDVDRRADVVRLARLLEERMSQVSGL